VNFADEAVLNAVLSMQHEIDGAAVRVDRHGNSAKQSGGLSGNLGLGGNLGLSSTLALGGVGGQAPLLETRLAASPIETRDRLKIWVGGLSQSTTKESLDAYFKQFGEAHSIVMMDGATGRSRGFGFVNFFDEAVFNAVLQMEHEIDGTRIRVDAKANSPAVSKPNLGLGGVRGASFTGGLGLGSEQRRPPELRDRLKVWVGGLSQSTNKTSMDTYFAQFGTADSIVMMDGATGRSRGFGFVNFTEEAAFAAVLSMQHEIDGAQVRVEAYNSGPKTSPATGANASAVGVQLPLETQPLEKVKHLESLNPQLRQILGVMPTTPAPAPVAQVAPVAQLPQVAQMAPLVQLAPAAIPTAAPASAASVNDIVVSALGQIAALLGQLAAPQAAAPAATTHRYSPY